MEIQKNRRIEYIDALKGFAIFCVLWGHSLQYLKNGYDFFHNPMFEFIYSFHMPLFFVVSGFFFYSSLKLDFKEFFYKKGIQLLLPCVTWAVVLYFIGFFTANLGIKEYFTRNWFGELKQIAYPTRWIWFLRELFISYSIVYVFLKTLNIKWLACVLSIIFVFIAPFCELQRTFLPMFWAGVYLKSNYQIVLKYSKQILIVSGIIFVICLFFWDGNYTIYNTGGSPKIFKMRTLSFNFTNIDIYAFRLLIGSFGSLFWFMLFEKIFTKSKFFVNLSKIGEETLAIYLLQILILESWTNKIIDFQRMNLWIYNLMVTPLISLVILIICLAVIKIIQKNKFAKLLLFGK